MQCFTKAEADFLAAKTRLQAAQIEKMEAVTEFLTARTALGQQMENIWPSFCECGAESGYDGHAYGQYETR